MTAYCLIEPALVAIPPVVDKPEAIFEWLEILQELGQVSRSSFARQMLKASGLAEALASANRYATVPSVREMLHDNGLREEFSASDILRSVQWLLTKVQSIEEAFEVSAVGDILDVSPLLISHSDIHLKQSMNETLLIACVVLNESAVFQFLIASPPRVTPIKSTSVDAQIIVTEIDPLTARPQEVIKDVHLDFPVVSSWRQFLNQLDAEKTWCTARDEVDLSFALVAHVSKTHYPVTSFEFGPGFVESLRRHGAWGHARFSKVVLGTCAGIVSSQTTIEIGPFYRDPNNEIQATKDGGALAWRAHVTKGGVGLRLMFWKSAGGAIEFSRVGPKNELRMD